MFLIIATFFFTEYNLLCVCVVFSFNLDVRFVDIPAGVKQEEGHTGFLHLPSATLASNCFARRFQPFVSLVDREIEFCVLTIIVLRLLGIFLGGGEESSSLSDDTEVRTHVPTSESLEVTN